MSFQSTSFDSIDDLINEIKKNYKAINKKEKSVEVERTWLVDISIIDYLMTLPNVTTIYKETFRGYLSVDPEVRYMCLKTFNGSTTKTKNFISYKSNGTLSREEYDVEIATDIAIKIAEMIKKDKSIHPFNGSKFIHKDYYKFTFTDNDLVLEVSIVDHSDDFVYMDIEFRNEHIAKTFRIPKFIKEFIIKEVTYDSAYKMKNYWKKTRLLNT